MQKSPRMLIEGIVIAASPAHQLAFIYIRGEYQLQADILEGDRRGERRRLHR